MGRWLKRNFIGIFLLVGIGCSRFHGPMGKMACLPIFQQSASLELSWPVGVGTDILSEHLRACFSSMLYVYPASPLCNAIDADSLSFSSYRFRYAKQLHLDWLITVSLDSLSSYLEWRGYRFDRERKEIFSFEVKSDIVAWEKGIRSVIDTVTQYEKWPHSCTFQIPTQDVTFWKTYGKGVIAYWQEKIDVADSALQSVGEMNPHWKHEDFLRIQVLLERAKSSSVFPEAYFYAKADTLLHFWESKNDSDYRVQWFRGKWHLQQQRWHFAEASLASAYRQCSHDPLLWVDISFLHPSRFRKLGFSDRISIYEKVLETDPTCESAWILLTQTFLHKGKLDVVEHLCQKWLSIFPRSLDAWFTLAKVFALRNDFFQLTNLYRQLVEWYPDRPEVYYNLGVLYFQARRLLEAEAFFNQSIQRKGHPDAFYYLGIIYEHLHQPEKAIHAYQKRIALRQSRSDRYADQAMIRLQGLLANQDST